MLKIFVFINTLICVFMEGEGDEIKYRQPSKRDRTLTHSDVECTYKIQEFLNCKHQPWRFINTSKYVVHIKKYWKCILPDAQRRFLNKDKTTKENNTLLWFLIKKKLQTKKLQPLSFFVPIVFRVHECTITIQVYVSEKKWCRNVLRIFEDAEVWYRNVFYAKVFCPWCTTFCSK